MSRVTVTELPPGTAATSASINDTITSWNNALAAGALGTNNVRLEGLDRRTLSASNKAIAGFYEQTTAGATGLVTSAAFVALVTSSDFTPTTGGDLIVRAVTFYSGEDEYATNNTVVTLRIERSTDGGGTWAAAPNTTLVRKNKNVDDARVTGNYYMFYSESTKARIRYRLVYTVTPGSVGFLNSALIVEQLAR